MPGTAQSRGALAKHLGFPLAVAWHAERDMPTTDRRNKPRGNRVVFNERERALMTEIIQNVCMRMGVVDMEAHAEDHRAIVQMRSSFAEMSEWFKDMRAKDRAYALKQQKRAEFWARMRERALEGMVGKFVPFIVWLPIFAGLWITHRTAWLGSLIKWVMGG